ncbi:hypothetical protein [Pedobacter cryophilus]|uniref:Uncharacterized protein n=1 Tax=Pedobacter cryophilus TaxID=2571271 RepID=A0A4U1BVL4_9SPHI|nr:hypothetical protein [Pedobacter cryophilus]TKB96859.1 hypothetical protein FA046_12335 [Pedobacter cryophilus]
MKQGLLLAIIYISFGMVVAFGYYFASRLKIIFPDDDNLDAYGSLEKKITYTITNPDQENSVPKPFSFMRPKYPFRFMNSCSRIKKSNRLRFSKKAKLKRRKQC